MKVHVLQHVPFEDIGSMAPWLAQHRATLSYTRFFEDTALPHSNDFDLVIAMGGPMSVNDEAFFPWLKTEKQFIRAAIERDTPVLGICLGAQLIASALGARVYPNAQKEIGWFPIEAVVGSNNGNGDTFRFPAQSSVFHWHGETFALPPGAVHLARSAACGNQAFQIGRHVIGLQFHLETTAESAASILTHCADELVAAPYVQVESELRAVDNESYIRINHLMAEVLAYLTRTSDQ